MRRSHFHIIIPKVPFCTWNRKQKLLACWLCRWIQVAIERILLFRLHDVLNRNVCRKGNALPSISSHWKINCFFDFQYHFVLEYYFLHKRENGADSILMKDFACLTLKCYSISVVVSTLFIFSSLIFRLGNLHYVGIVGILIRTLFGSN